MSNTPPSSVSSSSESSSRAMSSFMANLMRQHQITFVADDNAYTHHHTMTRQLPKQSLPRWSDVSSSQADSLATPKRRVSIEERQQSLLEQIPQDGVEEFDLDSVVEQVAKSLASSSRLNSRRHSSPDHTLSKYNTRYAKSASLPIRPIRRKSIEERY